MKSLTAEQRYNSIYGCECVWVCVGMGGMYVCVCVCVHVCVVCDISVTWTHPRSEAKGQIREWIWGVSILLTPTFRHETLRLREQFWESGHDDLGHDGQGLVSVWVGRYR